MNILIDTILAMLFALIVSLAICIIIVKTKTIHRKLTVDSFFGPQKFHFGDIPRVGGLAVLISLMGCVLFFINEEVYYFVLLSSLPIFIAGFFEDLFKNVSTKIRFYMSMLSGALFLTLSGIQFQNSGIFIIDNLFGNSYFWAFLTVVSIAALVNGINIIDGFHGLAGGSSMIMASGLLFIAINNDISELTLFLAIFIAAQFGFFIVNFPKGLIFMGDGGAYLSGFVLATSAIILTDQSINTAPSILLVIFSYPIVEVLFSIVRKSIRRGHSPDKPDSLHLHMLVHRSFRHLARKLGINKNAMTSVIMLFFPLSGLLFITFFKHDEIYIIIYFGLFLYAYFKLYRRVSLN